MRGSTVFKLTKKQWENKIGLFGRCGGGERGSCISNEKDKHFCVSFTLGTFMSLLLIFNKTDLNFFIFLLCEGFIKNVSETFTMPSSFILFKLHLCILIF